MKKSKKINNNMGFHKILLISTTLAFLFIIILSIGYSSFSVSLDIDADALVRADANIRFTNNSIKSLNDGGIEKAASKYTVNTISHHIELINCNSSAIYSVSVKNNNNYAIVIKSLKKELWNNDSIDLEVIGYTLGNEIIDANSEKTFEIKFKKKTCNLENNVLDSILKLEIAEKININYSDSIKIYSSNSNLKFAYKGDDVTVHFSGIEDYNIKVMINGKSVYNGKSYIYPDGTKSTFSIVNGTATVTNVNTDITFEKNDGIYVDLSKTGPVYSYTDKAKLTSVEFVEYVDLDDADIYWDITIDKNDLAYAWVKDAKLYIGSILTMKSLSLEGAFDGMTSVASIDFNDKLDTSETTTMKNMFYNCKSLNTIDVSSFDTSNTTSFEKMFTLTSNLVEIDVSNFNTSKVQNMSMMFSRSGNKGTANNKLERIIGLENFDTSNVTNAEYLFSACNHVKELNVGNWNTSKMKDTSFMFLSDSELTTLDVSKWNVSNVTRMDQMFQSCKSLNKLDVSGWNTRYVQNMFRLFYGLTISELYITNFDTSKCNNFSDMFANMPNIEVLDLSSFNTSNTKYIENMFANSPKLKTIYVSSKWNYEKTSSFDLNIFNNNINLVGGNGTIFNQEKISTEYGRVDTNETPGYFTLKEPVDIVSLNKTSGYYKDEPYKSKIKTATFVNYINTENAAASWDLSASKDGSVMVWVEENGEYYDLYFGSQKCITPTGQNAAAMFHSLSALETVKFNGLLDTSLATSIKSMFMKCTSLKSVDFETLNTRNAVDMQEVFQEAKALEYVNLSNIITDKVTNMNRMFASANSLKEIDLTNFNTSNVTTMTSMFSSCSSLTSLDVSHFDTSKVTNMEGMFQNTGNLTSIDVSHFDTSNVLNMKGMFGYMKSLSSLNVSNFDTSKVTNMYGMFASLQGISELDLRSFDTSSVTNMSQMFYNESILKTIYVSDKWDISSVDTYSNIFYNDRKLVGQNGTVFDASKNNSIDYAVIDGKDGKPGFLSTK